MSGRAVEQLPREVVEQWMERARQLRAVVMGGGGAQEEWLARTQFAVVAYLLQRYAMLEVPALPESAAVVRPSAGAAAHEPTPRAVCLRTSPGEGKAPRSLDELRKSLGAIHDSVQRDEGFQKMLAEAKERLEEWRRQEAQAKWRVEEWRRQALAEGQVTPPCHAEAERSVSAVSGGRETFGDDG